MTDLRNKGEELGVVQGSQHLFVCESHFLSLGWEPLSLERMTKGGLGWMRLLHSTVRVWTSRQTSPGLTRQGVLPVGPKDRSCLLSLPALALSDGTGLW